MVNGYRVPAQMSLSRNEMPPNCLRAAGRPKGIVTWRDASDQAAMFGNGAAARRCFIAFLHLLILTRNSVRNNAPSTG